MPGHFVQPKPKSFRQSAFWLENIWCPISISNRDVRMYVHIRIYVCSVFVCICMHAYICMSTYVYVCVYACVYVYVRICMYVHTYLHIFAHWYTQLHVAICVQKYCYDHMTSITWSCVIGNSTLREIFMKTDNYIRGKYFGNLIKVGITWYTI